MILVLKLSPNMLTVIFPVQIQIQIADAATGPAGPVDLESVISLSPVRRRRRAGNRDNAGREGRGGAWRGVAGEALEGGALG